VGGGGRVRFTHSAKDFYLDLERPVMENPSPSSSADVWLYPLALRRPEDHAYEPLDFLARLAAVVLQRATGGLVLTDLSLPLAFSERNRRRLSTEPRSVERLTSLKPMPRCDGASSDYQIVGLHIASNALDPSAGLAACFLRNSTCVDTRNLGHFQLVIAVTRHPLPLRATSSRI